jgi:hypothetical protein
MIFNQIQNILIERAGGKKNPYAEIIILVGKYRTSFYEAFM